MRGAGRGDVHVFVLLCLSFSLSERVSMHVRHLVWSLVSLVV